MDFHIEEYIRTCPGAELQDVLKYLYQSSFGCEHLVEDNALCLQKIREELNSALPDTGPSVELLSGDYCRIRFGALEEGLSPETLCKLFLLSAEKVPEGKERLAQGLEKLRALSIEGKISFTREETEEAIRQWESRGFCPCHHSDSFRNRYHPAYRVVRREYGEILPLLIRIDRLLRKKSCIVAVDGPCASGKTTLGEYLRRIYDCNVFHMDDFFLRPEQRTPERLNTPGENVDYERFLPEVLIPLSKGETVFLRRYDCHEGKLKSPLEVTGRRLNIVEGVYSQREDLRSYYDLCAVTDISPREQKQRILARNPGPFAEHFFNEWIPMEERYFSAYHIRERADLILKIGTERKVSEDT